MKINFDNRELSWNDLKLEVILMSRERILSQFLKKNGSNLCWFHSYQKNDIKFLESTIAQIDEQEEDLVSEEKEWRDNLEDFYQDFSSFDWELYNSLTRQEKDKLEEETALRWARKLRKLTLSYQSNCIVDPNVRDFNDPVKYISAMAETEYEISKFGIRRPKGLFK